MFSSNNTPADEFVHARELGQRSIWTPMKIALKSVTSIPKVISCRYNPGGVLNWEPILWTILKKPSLA